MAKILSGLTEVAHATAVGGSFTAIAGDIAAESTLEVPNTQNETTTGLTWGGGQIIADIRFLDHAGYATAEGWMTGDTKLAFRFTLDDGTVWAVQRLVQPFAERMPGLNARDGVVAWALTFEKYGSIVMLS